MSTSRNLCKYAWFEPMASYLAAYMQISAEEPGFIVSNVDNFIFYDEAVISAPPFDVEKVKINETNLYFIFKSCYDMFAFTEIFPPGSQMILSVEYDECVYFISEGTAYEFPFDEQNRTLQLSLVQFSKIQNESPCNRFGEVSFDNIENFYFAILAIIEYFESLPSTDCVDGIKFNTAESEGCAAALPIKIRVATDAKHLLGNRN